MENTEKVLSYLEDEQSRFIYQKRVEYNETGDFRAINAIVERYVPGLQDKPYYPGMESRLPELLKDKKNIVIFGSGMNGKRCRALCGRMELCPPVMRIMQKTSGEPCWRGWR